MVLGSNSDHQSRLRNESISGRFARGGEHLHLLIASLWPGTGRRLQGEAACLVSGVLLRHEVGQIHRQSVQWFTEE
jgi:hypothetical protein